MAVPCPSSGDGGVPSHGNDGDALALRQLSEDVVAYKYDLEFCTNQLAQDELTAAETRALQLRALDVGHKIRHAQHAIEKLQAKRRDGASFSSPSRRPPSSGGGAGEQPTTKRPRAETPTNVLVDDGDGGSRTPDTVAVQRLGFWKCRLCTSAKYILAGEGRLPSAPCKWPLRDIAKMMTHYFDLHTEHGPAERCMELGEALHRNRESGPRGHPSSMSRLAD